MTNRHRERIVRHDLSTDDMTCTYRKFEFMGIQCCHVLKALDFMNIKRLPEKYYLKRWQKNAKTGKNIALLDTEIRSEVHMAKRYSVLMRTFTSIFSTSSQSDKAYRYVLGIAKGVMSKVEELASQDSGGTQIDDSQLPTNDTSKVTSEATSKKPTGIRKKDSERGRRCRYPNSLENKKKRKLGKWLYRLTVLLFCYSKFIVNNLKTF